MDLEKINFGYSIKNIPIPPKHQYLKQFLAKMEFLKPLIFIEVNRKHIFCAELQN